MTVLLAVVSFPASVQVEGEAVPVRVHFEGARGCYIAAYTHDRARSEYPVSDTIFVVGFIRVRGSYDDAGVCQPSGFENEDISAQTYMTVLTNRYYPGRAGGTWAGGDTGGFFR